MTVHYLGPVVLRLYCALKMLGNLLKPSFLVPQWTQGSTGKPEKQNFEWVLIYGSSYQPESLVWSHWHGVNSPGVEMKILHFQYSHMTKCWMESNLREGFLLSYSSQEYSPSLNGKTRFTVLPGTWENRNSSAQLDFPFLPTPSITLAQSWNSACRMMPSTFHIGLCSPVNITENTVTGTPRSVTH